MNEPKDQSPPAVAVPTQSASSSSSAASSPSAERPKVPADKTPVSQAPSPAKGGYRERIQRGWHITQLVGCVLLGAAAGYFVASLRADAQMQQAESGFTEQLTQLESRYRAEQARAQALMARRDLHQALVSLDQRNFGTTERLARQAGETLTSLGGQYSALGQTLTSFRPTVSDDVSKQREALLDIAQSVDKEIDAMPRP